MSTSTIGNGKPEPTEPEVPDDTRVCRHCRGLEVDHPGKKCLYLVGYFEPVCCVICKEAWIVSIEYARAFWDDFQLYATEWSKHTRCDQAYPLSGYGDDFGR